MKSAPNSVPAGAAGIPVPFEITLPPDTPEYMAPAYFDCLHWALGFDPVLEQFKQETGISFSPARSKLEIMIDIATSHSPEEDFLRSFVPWFNAQVWGAMEGGKDGKNQND